MWVVLPIAVAIVAVVVGGTPSPPAPDRPSPSGDRNPVVFAPGRMVAIGAGRTLYLRCTGTGTPTVILASGTANASDDWVAVQGPLTRVTRTCAYDRAGAGNSLPAPGASTPAADLADLRRLAFAARLPAPYVLVGAGYGGLLARLYAQRSPHDVAGLVLVDAITPGSAETSLGALPLIVITRGLYQDTQLRAQGARTAMQDRLASLSTDSLHVTALRSGYGVWRVVAGQPDVVVAGAVAVVQAARTGSGLPSCARVYRAAGTRCAG